MFTGWSGVVVGSFALAAISMVVLRGSVAYDPYSWLIWGREIAHLDLNTRSGATAVKPLPMVVTTIFAWTGSVEPAIWLLIARAGALFMFGATFRLAWRRRGVAAGVIAVLGLFVSNWLVGYLFMRGMSEPMAAGFTVAAVDAFLMRRHRWALGCLIASAYLRAEGWPILLVYLIWLAWPHGWVRRGAAAAVGIFVPVSWFLFDVFGAHQFFRSAEAAQHQSQGGPLLSRYPGIATFTETRKLASAPVVVLFVVALVIAVAVWWRSGHTVRPLDLTPEFVVTVVALVWIVVDAVLAQGRFATGAPRYLLPAEALACVAAGWLVTDGFGWAAKHWAVLGRPLLPGVGAVLLFAVVLAPSLDRGVRQVRLGRQLGAQYRALAARLTTAIDEGGGRSAVVACGPLSTSRFEVPLVAWQLHVPIADVSTHPGPVGTFIRQAGLPPLPTAVAGGYARVAHVHADDPAGAGWEVYRTCRS